MNKKQLSLWTTPIPSPNPEWIRDESPPVFWVEEIRILRSLCLDGTALVRRIRLHRGLNILWAKPPATEEARPETSTRKESEDKLHDPSVAGHSAGKTTFTRLIRFVLGEPTFGDEQLTANIREEFPDGWVVACVHIDNQSWIVARPFVESRESFAIRSGDWNDVLSDSGRMSFEDYTEALQSATFSGLSDCSFPSGAGHIAWPHLLPWITRDQDCHFSNVTNWRCNESQSRAITLKAADRHFLLQTFLGLLDKSEIEIARANNRYRKQIAEAKEKLAKLEHQEKVDGSRLSTSFGDTLPPFDNGLFDGAVDSAIEAKHSRPAEPKTDDDPIEKLQDELERLVEQFARKKAEAEEAEKDKQNQEVLYKRLAGTASEEEARRDLENAGPSLAYCPVPIEEALASGCTLCRGAPRSIDKARLEKDLAGIAKKQEAIAEAAAQKAKHRSAGLEIFERAVKSVRARLRKARQKENDFIKRKSQYESNVSDLKRQAQLAKDSWTQAEAIRKEIRTLTKSIREANKDIKLQREQKSDGLVRFEAIFDYCVSALLGSEVHGRVELDGKRLRLKLLYRRELRGSAMTLVRSIAFDIASILASVDGTAKHPRFLIHDGPRDSDLTAQLYQRIFMLARAMEGSRSDGHEPPFQYIITTTEPPPIDMQRSEWLLDPVLDATDPSKRLLGVDL